MAEMSSAAFKELLRQKTDDMEQEGVIQTGMGEVILVKLTRPVARTSAILAPGICLVAQGAKHIYLGEERYTYDEHNFLLGSCKLPVYAELKTASAKRPYYGMAILLNTRIVSELVLEYDRMTSKKPAGRPDGLLTCGKISPELEAAICRLLNVLGDSQDEAILGPSLLREIYYIVLKSKAGPFLKNASYQHSKAHQVAPLIHYLEEHLREDVSIADLVELSGMSASTLHESFRKATTLPPMQYLKRLRLNHAHQQLMLGRNVSEAAMDSGYGSATQFSREFKRLFGLSPSEVVS
ncbi:MAG: AraC family transcriptional regulator [Proteobacteria bacterium]|nr:AraC family transcriptional regulator [Pseudomonadota bacterium]